MTPRETVNYLFDGLNLRKISQNSRPISPVKELLSIAQLGTADVRVEIEVYAPSGDVYSMNLGGKLLSDYFNDTGNLSHFFKLKKAFTKKEIVIVRKSLSGSRGIREVSTRLVELGWDVTPVSAHTLSRDILKASTPLEDYVKRNYS